MLNKFTYKVKCYAVWIASIDVFGGVYTKKVKKLDFF